MKIQIIVCLLMICFLIGCNMDESAQIASTKIPAISDIHEEKPPTLIIMIGEEVIKTYTGAYSWHYIKKSTGEVIQVQTDHAPPYEMVNIEEGTTVNLTEHIDVRFSIEPSSYELRLWNSEEVIATYNSFEEIKERGNYIVEVVGNWEESRATYVAALNITKQ
ncbi:hypothetical protein [Ureibacillus chungkukjangi]|uniref:Proteinase inhibitor I42 chagasin domain-containing protein n=1 Tax=Ureibacillus chungkukjangi TaxID=1202712 RepID=A0A318TQ35_9BACL|nr:hypothetical protein [Ureibacillus chungkukjangi]PYF06784.1 hypothetical protein BJ095_10718 [Ureibacillus chungkukjangi]